MRITVAEVRRAATADRVRARRSEGEILAGEAASAGAHNRFDIFLSHSFGDRELVLGTKRLIEQRGLSVYVDWIDDPALDRSATDRDSADRLRGRMRQCDTLFYAHTPNAALSRWCPWELGYFDALKAPDRQVFVLPVEDDERYTGQEYLSLYEIVDLNDYRHRPAPVRERSRQTREDLLRTLGGRGLGPFGRPML